MNKAIHVYASKAKNNSGDFFLGPATKWKFEKTINKKLLWTSFDVRRKVDDKDIEFFNQHDYLVLGGGGLFLPDTNPNQISCWQWPIRSSDIKKINSKIHVVSIGWNHFYQQDITMSDRHSNSSIEIRRDIFKDNIETLLRKSESFTVRHKGDCEQIKRIVSPELHQKINFDFCPVVSYVRENFFPDFNNNKVYHAFEIKDDRPNRRYYKKGREKFYQELLQYINTLLSKQEKIAVMSHDGSSTFCRFLNNNKIPFVVLDNSVANEVSIIENYSKVKKLYCMAGHSQMMAHALDLDYYSLITHDKLKFFLQDNGNFSQNNYCMVNEENINEKIVL